MPNLEGGSIQEQLAVRNVLQTGLRRWAAFVSGRLVYGTAGWSVVSATAHSLMSGALAYGQPIPEPEHNSWDCTAAIKRMLRQAGLPVAE